MKFIKEEPLLLTIAFDDEAEKLTTLKLLTSNSKKLIGNHRGKDYLLSLEDIYYIESVDKTTLIYTKKDCYASALWLYQIESQLDNDFIRINKATIINMTHLESMKADLGARIVVYLDNHDMLVVTRTYAKEFKRRLGGN